ncbi:MAG: 30S ribosomal protein S4 [Deltaproteobacteria bacterium]|nr:30S ribosomal protein S4 [Deltaproteobacteria bacterium]
MARHIASVCRLCRREGMKLFLKGDRCFTEKCAVERREYAPGQHGQNRRKLSEYGVQLREKQKVRRRYGLVERQFRLTFARAEQMRGVTGENLLQLLERRLDNVVYRCGFARSLQEARQLVRHGHFAVNDRKVDIPSFTVNAGDVVRVREGSAKVARIAEAVEGVDRRGGVPEWLQVEKERMTGRIAGLPSRQHLTLPIQEQLIVELYSK